MSDKKADSDKEIRPKDSLHYLTLRKAPLQSRSWPGKRIKLSDQIRRAIDSCGQKTRYAIAKATGVSEATLSRFMSGNRGLPMKTLDTLADYLDLDIAKAKSAKAKKGK